MKQLKEKLEQISELSAERKKVLENQTRQLKSKAGAEIRIDSIRNNIVELSVNNINGKRVSKYELFSYTHKLFSENIPRDYRLIIKL